MISTIESLPPLPEVLRQPRTNGTGRRHRVGEYSIDPLALQHFNELLENLELRHPPLDSDQVASAARELVDQPLGGRAPPCIQQRVRRGAAVDRMMTDPEWDVVATSAFTVAMVVAYLRGHHTLIPNDVPVVGRLDDAIVVEASWPAIAQEVSNYLDFCRIRRIEASLRGEERRHFGFGRMEWRDAAPAEVEWIAHCQRVGGESYVPADPADRFRVS